MIEKICENCRYKYVQRGMLADNIPYCGACHPRSFEMWLVELKVLGHSLYLEYSNALTPGASSIAYNHLVRIYRSKNNLVDWIMDQRKHLSKRAWSQI